MKTSLVDNEAKTNFPLTNSSNAIGIGLEPMTDSDIAHEDKPMIVDNEAKTILPLTNSSKKQNESIPEIAIPEIAPKGIHNDTAPNNATKNGEPKSPPIPKKPQGSWSQGPPLHGKGKGKGKGGRDTPHIEIDLLNQLILESPAEKLFTVKFEVAPLNMDEYIPSL